MKIKIEYIILAVIILALSVYLLSRNTDKINYALPVLSAIEVNDIKKVEISGPKHTITLNKKDSKWYINEQRYPADSVKVKNILDVIGKLDLTAMVSESKKYSRYNLADGEAINVRAWVEEKVGREFMIGKTASSYQHTFVRIAGDERVYHASGSFRGKFEQTPDTLRDKVVLSFKPVEIQGIDILKGDKSLTFSRTEIPVEMSNQEKPDSKAPSDKKAERLWKNAEGKEADQSSLNSLLSMLSHLRCDSFPSDTKKNGLKNPVYRIKAKGLKTYELSIFPKIEKYGDKYPAVSSENEYPFLLTSLQAENIMKKVKGFETE